MLSYIILLLYSILVIYTDFRYGKIFNWLNFSLFFIGIIVAIYQHNILSSLFGVLIGFFLMIPFFIRGGMGAGDVKFAMATGALVGGNLLLRAFIVAGLLILIYAIVKKMAAFQLLLKGLKDTIGMAKTWIKNVFIGMKISAETQRVFVPIDGIENKEGERYVVMANKIRYGVFLGFSNILISLYYIIIEQGGIK